MAGPRHTPAWMSAVIVLSAFAMLTALGCFLHFYSRHASIREEYHATREKRVALDRAKQPLQDAINQLQTLITAHRRQYAAVQTNVDDERRSIRSLLEQEAVRNQNIQQNTERIVTSRRGLMRQLEDVRGEWSREEDLRLSAAAEHEQALRRLRDDVKRMSHEIERQYRNARIEEVALLRDIERLDARVRSLLNQQDTETTELTTDGRIIAARADLGFAIIDVGWENNLRPGTSFQVFTTRAGRNIIKGHLEVLRVEERIAHVRILEERHETDPIIVGDRIYNPIYDPHETKVFVIKGDFSRYSPAELRRFIEEAGGRVADDLDNKTDYLVAGEDSQRYLDLASNYGVVILSEQKLMEFIRMPTTQATSTLDVVLQK